MDILKETDLRVAFTEQFKSVANREILDRDTLQKRLILSLYGLGTNTGLKLVTAGDHGESYKDLLYVRRKFIHKENIRNAIAEVVAGNMGRRDNLLRFGFQKVRSLGSKFDDGVTYTI